MDFIKNISSSNNDTVNTPYVIGVFIVLALATPIVLLSMAVVVWHIFYHNKPLDSPTTQLLLGLLGAVTGGLASALLSKGSWLGQVPKGMFPTKMLPGLTKAPRPDNPDEGEV
jgi:hypothetical protein